jgi:membrane protein DedA with SNARE-associated domain/rhodanese-related sulfurtransferase
MSFWKLDELRKQRRVARLGSQIGDDMTQVVDFLIRNGEMIVFASVFAEQIGLPVPAVPVLLAAGALAGLGKMNLAFAVFLAVLACLVGDVLWYELGRHRGRQALNVLCRISLEPDSCVRRTQDFFTRHGLRSLIFAKFIPGLSTLAPALAGLFRVSAGQFLLYNGVGALLWSVSFIALGWLFSNQIEFLAEQAARFGESAVVLLAGSLAAYLIYKYVHRRKLLRELRVARITPDELKQLMDNGHNALIVDLRGALDHEADPYTIPGALRIPAEQFEHRHHDIPRDQEVILFCACPNEATAARMALQLKRMGITRVRPLAGGIDGWRERAFPLELRLPSGEPVGML